MSDSPRCICAYSDGSRIQKGGCRAHVDPDRNGIDQSRAMMNRRGEQVGPWIVILSQHLPVVREDGETSEPYVSCSCGNGLYVGHLARVLADRAAPLLAAAHAAGVALGKAEEREGWASWLESWLLAVGPEPPTPEAILDWLRAGQRPFGVAARIAEGGDS